MRVKGRSNEGQPVDLSQTAYAEEPKRDEFYISDFTIESLRPVFKNNPRGVISYQDEMSGHIKSFNQYKPGGNDREQITSLFDAGPLKSNRKTEGAQYSPNSGLAVIGGIQPEKMVATIGTDSFDDGLMPRFIFFNAHDLPMTYTDDEIDGLENWENLLKKAYEREPTIDANGRVVPDVISLGEPAYKRFKAFYAELGAHKPYLSPRGKVFLPKLLGYYLLKFSGLLQCINALSTGTKINGAINLETIENAIKLTRYFAHQAMKTVELYNPSKRMENAFKLHLIETLFKLKGEVRKGKLPISKKKGDNSKVINILDAFNSGLPPEAIHNPKQIGMLLKELELSTSKSTGGYFVLRWDSDKINNLFTQYISTISTSSTVSTTTRPGIVEVKNPKSTKSTNNDNNGNNNGSERVDMVDVENLKSTDLSQQRQDEVEKVDIVDVDHVNKYFEEETFDLGDDLEIED